MKNLIFICCIIIILFKTGNVLSDSDIFNVNNIEIDKETYKNKDKLVNKAFIIGYDRLINRLLMKGDYDRISNVNLKEIKELISYYQIINPEKEKLSNKIKVNVFFDKTRIHDFFYNKNILYSDIINTEIILFPLFKKENKYFIYSQNYFYENWIKESSNSLIQYFLPVENIESIQKVNLIKDSIYDLDISNFFKEYEINNKVFTEISINNNAADIFLIIKINEQKINKKIRIIKKENINDKDFYKKIILEINTIVTDLIKQQNLIDVRTPSFLNVKIILNNKNNLILLNNKLKKIDLINSFYVQKLNKDYALVKIKYLGKIKKIINKLKKENIYLKMHNGEWEIKIT
jgi:hypothetical protein